MVWILFSFTLLFQEDMPSTTPRDRSNGYLSEIPNHVFFMPDKVSLFADFKQATEGEIPIYIVNDSDSIVDLYHMAGDVLLYQETSLNEWERSQTIHSGAICGNRLLNAPFLPPQTFAVYQGVYPHSGKRAEVRYHCFLAEVELISNGGMGFVDLTELAEVAYDEYTIAIGPIDQVIAIAQGKLDPEIEIPKGLRFYAMLKIQQRLENDPGRLVEIFTAIAEDRYDPWHKYAHQVLATLKNLD